MRAFVFILLLVEDPKIKNLEHKWWKNTTADLLSFIRQHSDLKQDFERYERLGSNPSEPEAEQLADMEAEDEERDEYAGRAGMESGAYAHLGGLGDESGGQIGTHAGKKGAFGRAVASNFIL